MKKFWIVYAHKNDGTFHRHETRALADAEAKRRQFNDHGNTYYVLEAVSATVNPVPDVKMQELT